MTPDPHPTLMERADELDAAAHKAFGLHDFVFAKKLEAYANELRMQHLQEQKNAAKSKLHT